MQGRKEGLPNPKPKKELPSSEAPASSSGKRAQSTPIGRVAESTLDGLPELGAGQQGATLKDLCEEDKQKVARLIRQVVSITKEKEKLQRGAVEERQSQQKVLEALQAQNRELIEEVTGLRLKLVQAQGLLRTYQHKLRVLKEGPTREASLHRPTSPLEPELLISPTYAPPARLPQPLASDTALLSALASSFNAAPPLQGPLSPVQAQGATKAINTPEETGTSINHGKSSQRPGRADTTTLQPNGLNKTSDGGVAPCLSAVQLGSGAPPSETGVWAAWAELEQRIRCINGELAQTKTAAAAAAKDQPGTIVSPALERDPPLHCEAAVKVSDEEKAVPTEDVSTSAPQAASEDHGRSREGLDAAEATNGPSQANGACVNSPPPQVLGSSQMRDEASLRSLVGGLVSQPQLTCHPPKEPPGTSLQSSTAPADALRSAELPPSEASPTVLSPSSPAACPLSPSMSPTWAGKEGSLPPLFPSAGLPVKSPPQQPNVHLQPVPAVVPADVAVSSGQERMQDVKTGLDPVSHQRASTAVLAAVIEANLVQRSRETDARIGSHEQPVELPLKGRDRERVQVLRFDPTVGEAGAFYYVDACTEAEAQDEARGELTSAEGVRVAKRAVSPSQGSNHVCKEYRTADGESVEADPKRSERGAAAEPRARDARHPVRSSRKENGAQNESPERGRFSEGRPRWVSGMLYDSSLLELVEELEMRDGQEGAFEDTSSAEPTRVERGESLKAQRNVPRQAVSRTARLGKGHASTRVAQHRLCKDPRLEPEVLILSNGW